MWTWASSGRLLVSASARPHKVKSVHTGEIAKLLLYKGLSQSVHIVQTKAPLLVIQKAIMSLTIVLTFFTSAILSIVVY